MRLPVVKKSSKIVPSFLAKYIIAGIRMMYEWRLYDDRRPCPKCGCKNHTRLDKVRKIFCRVIEDSGISAIRINLKRYRCHQCKHIYTAQGPFYPNTEYGKPIVDLALYFASTNPYNRVEHILMELGIQIDRDTVKRYVKLFKNRSLHVAGIKFAGKSIGVNVLKLLFGKSTVEELKKAYPDKRFDAVADETYPAKKGAKKKLRKENRERKRDGKKPKRFPDSFTLASSYLPGLESYASVLVSSCAFNWLLGKILVAPLAGAPYLCVDGSPCYDFNEIVRCLVHKARNLAKRDPILKKLIDEKTLEDSIIAHLKEVYRDLKHSTIKKLKEKFPELVDENGVFTGAVNTNAMEGGNFRMKWNLRVPYKDIEGIFGRTILSTIHDSIHTFKNGRPCESFANIHGIFQYENVMNSKPPPIIKLENCVVEEINTIQEEWYDPISIEEYLIPA